ncbi:DNA primase [Helicobacter mesocricetorum]|uniref:DNA primase n=1 Tax=Helicobacter mesocricetorum TaxID=87012 RepID=UPI001F34AE57|nr:DNA primase [Helicobacter mesocricetorum]
MALITQESVENLKNRLDIVEVISHYIEVKKMGATYKACCPFHQEKTPSFVINANKGYYHCFGCGVSGDSIRFVMEYEKLSYKETLERLAQIYNIPLVYTQTHKPKEDNKILDFMNEYYQSRLNEEANNYIKKRGITESIRKLFEIGYAPNNYEIMGYLQKHFISLSEALNLGVLGVDNENGVKHYYARLTQRLIFPIRSPQNKIVGFGGRTLGNHRAKYINSPQTKLFNKSQLLYGYPQAKENIYKKGEIIVTEGYLDVIMLHQAGFNNAVATLGTALTKEHLPLIAKGNPKVIIAYDGDSAGIKAAFKAAMLLSLAQKEGGVVIFDKGLDPADMVNNGEIEQLKDLLYNPTSLIDFVFGEIIAQYDLNNPMQKDSCLKESLEFLHQLSSVLQEEYRVWLGQKLHLPLHLIPVKTHKNNIKPTSEILQNNEDFYTLVEKIIIKSVLEDMELLEYVMNYLETSMFFSQREAYEKLLKKDLEDSQLIGILLDERIKAQNKENLKRQMIMVLYKHYDEQRKILIKDSTLSLREKSFLLRKYQQYLENLKKGDLIINESLHSF